LTHEMQLLCLLAAAQGLLNAPLATKPVARPASSPTMQLMRERYGYDRDMMYRSGDYYGGMARTRRGGWGGRGGLGGDYYDRPFYNRGRGSYGMMDYGMGGYGRGYGYNGYGSSYSAEERAYSRGRGWGMMDDYYGGYGRGYGRGGWGMSDDYDDDYGYGGYGRGYGRGRYGGRYGMSGGWGMDDYDDYDRGYGGGWGRRGGRSWY